MTSEFGEILDALQDALRLAGAPVMDLLNPGLEADEVELAAAKWMPRLAPIVDDVIKQWWSWQNGVNPKLARQSGFKAAAKIASGPLIVQNLDIALEGYLFGMGGYEGYRTDVFPICDNETGGSICIAKADVRGGWEMCVLPKSPEDWFPIYTEWNAPNPSFFEYIERLGTAIRQGHLVPGPYGQMVGAGDNPRVCYPFFQDRN